VSDGVLREVWHGRVWRANACRVIEENAGRIALWLPRGAPAKYAAREDGTEIRIPVADWSLSDRTNPRDGLGLFQLGARHSLWHFWDENGSLAYWYVNFEQPLRRTELGFDYQDEKLDIVVEPDGRWYLKDEDELEQAAGLGLVDADAVRAEAARVLAAPPWPSGWEDWQPDPAWSIPKLPEGWDAV